MLDSGAEPEVGHPLRKAYWDMRDRYETSLMREMYIGDQPDIKFQLDFPKAGRARSRCSGARARARPTSWST